MTRLLVLVATVAALALPGSASAACTSELPVADRRLASHHCTHASPGMLLRVPSKKYGELSCTAGFAFADQTGARYLTFPGSCHLDFECLEDIVLEELDIVLPVLPPIVLCTMPSDSEEEPVYGRTGPTVFDADHDPIGRIVYAVNKNGVDFALVRIDPSVSFDKAVPFFGGPTRLGAPDTAAEEAYSYSGHAGTGSLNARTGVLHGSETSLYHLTEGISSVAKGSPVLLTDGTGVGYYSGGLHLNGGYRVTPYGPALERTRVRTRLVLKLLTAPLA